MRMIADLRAAVWTADAQLEAESARLRSWAEELERASHGEPDDESADAMRDAWVLAKGLRDAARALDDTRALLALAREREG